jgi:hypothetical protein
MLKWLLGGRVRLLPETARSVVKSLSFPIAQPSRAPDNWIAVSQMHRTVSISTL